MTDETLKDVAVLLRLFLFLIGGITLLEGLIWASAYGRGDTLVALGLGMLATGVVWWIVDMQPPTSKRLTSQIPDGKVRCPHCGAEVELVMRPEPLSLRRGEVTYICPKCGKRI